jgi:hypothetical protein
MECWSNGATGSTLLRAELRRAGKVGDKVGRQSEFPLTLPPPGEREDRQPPLGQLHCGISDSEILAALSNRV